MITRKQQKWIDHLSDVDKIKIVPFDPTAKDKFQKVKQQIKGALGKDIPVVHRGASSLGISGQDEIDIYIPVPPRQFDVFLINNECEGWVNGLKFENYLRSHPEVLEEYRKLKEDGDGLSGREYYTKKIEFFNETLSKLESQH